MIFFFVLILNMKGTIEEQLNFCFTVYDLNDDGYIRSLMVPIVRSKILFSARRR